MYPVGQMKSYQHSLYKTSFAMKHSSPLKAKSRMQPSTLRQGKDTVNIHSTSAQGESQTNTGIYTPDYNQDHNFYYSQEVNDMDPNVPMAQTIDLDKFISKSEVIGYTEHDALMDQYLKQYRIDGHFEGDKFILDSNKPAGLVIISDISDAKLEKFRQGLVQKGLGSDIDWRGVNSDLGDMNVDFYNVKHLDVKVDYLSSRYAVLENRIRKQYTGDEQAVQMGKLNKIYSKAKEDMAASYADEIGEFYESLGQKGTAADFKASVENMVDTRTIAYKNYLSTVGNYAKISNPENSWLLQDDAFMAGQLRISYLTSTQKAEPAEATGKYDVKDLTFAGVYAKSLSSQIKDHSWDTELDDRFLGQALARQYDNTQTIVADSGISIKLANLIDNSFRPFIEKFMDALDKSLDEEKEMVRQNPWMGGIVRTSHINRSLVYAAYQNY